MTLYNTQGTFLVNEPFTFNGIEDGRVGTAVTHYGVKNVKSIYGGPDLGNVGFAKTFAADVIQKDGEFIGDATITSVNGSTGISTITSPNPLFPSNVKVNDILAFGGESSTTISYARVTTVGTSDINAVSYTHLTLPTTPYV